MRPRRPPARSGASFRFFGVDDHYFVAAVVEAPGTQQVDFAHVPLPDPAIPAAVRQLVAFNAAFDAPPASLRFFVGPKQFEALRAVDPEFTKVINFGMFAILAVPLLGALQWVNGFVGNYGWSIVILTILINLVMWPLRHKSVVSMRRMQELQPQLKAIQDRYSHLKMTDPGPAEDERRGDGALQGQGRQPGQRLRADAADPAGPLRLLLAAVAGDRDPRRAVRAAGSPTCRSTIRGTSPRC